MRDAWTARAGQLGEPLSVKTADGPVAGRFAGLDESGALLLLDANGQTRAFTYGDVLLGADGAATT
ncbi:MAG: hypothetical protein SFX73_13195 [Kofleriaceae bacterium]|nr:hypothetical protein [Kofleriaceae bacterium]